MFFFSFDENKNLDSKETLYAAGNEPKITRPYDPMKVDIISQTFSLQSIIERLENKEIELEPDFQRNRNLWTQMEQSRLIESILIRVPLPAFYFDGRNENCWTIIDGLQRISTIHNFIVRPPHDALKLRLDNLEYLTEYNGRSYEELPRQLQRRIKECQIFCYCIRSGTPDDVTISIFKRINTGGLPLSLAEIRNAVYRGLSADLVRKMAETECFKIATRKKIQPVRMEDRDFVTRFLAFYLLGYETYTGDMNAFLEAGMSHVKIQCDETQCEQIFNAFERAMNVCYSLFGKKSFRKLSRSGKFGPLNKSLFECVSVTIAKLKSEEQNALMCNQELVFDEYKKMFASPFYESITSATGTIEHVRKRYETLSEFFRRILARCA